MKRENAYRFAVCFICKEEGHLAKVHDNSDHYEIFIFKFRRVQTTPKVFIQKEEAVFSVEVWNT